LTNRRSRGRTTHIAPLPGKEKPVMPCRGTRKRTRRTKRMHRVGCPLVTRPQGGGRSEGKGPPSLRMRNRGRQTRWLSSQEHAGLVILKFRDPWGSDATVGLAGPPVTRKKKEWASGEPTEPKYLSNAAAAPKRGAKKKRIVIDATSRGFHREKNAVPKQIFLWQP